MTNIFQRVQTTNQITCEYGGSLSHRDTPMIIHFERWYIFPEINQRAWGTPMTMEPPIYCKSGKLLFHPKKWLVRWIMRYRNNTGNVGMIYQMLCLFFSDIISDSSGCFFETKMAHRWSATENRESHMGFAWICHIASNTIRGCLDQHNHQYWMVELTND